ncbi:CD225/dispanin family protein [uncultured Corynebacterium sp.]|uniref:CD225/dispanin family protein n=1 Tax=uncultured Corynebacterium sp. TaxID=159447 RepID=UPI0025FE42B1|nr:CD225/dispanin family protein [uncultured Corynebacterium sp.]
MTNPYEQNPSNDDPFGKQENQSGYPYNSGYDQSPNQGQSQGYGGYQSYSNNAYPNQSAGYGAQLGQSYQPGVGNTPPDNWMWATILTTLLCCLPLGAVGIYYSSQVESRWYRGDYQGSQDASNKAKNLALASVITSVVLVVLYFVFFVGILGMSLNELSET